MTDPAPDDPATPRWIDLDGVVNMRDLGGLPTTDGGSVLPGRLIRSDNLQELAPDAVRRLVDELRVTDVVDLRTVVEVAKEGNSPLVAEPGVTIHHLTLYTEDSAETGIPAGERDLPWVGDRNMADASVGQKKKERKQERKAERRTHDAYWSDHYLGYLSQRPDSVVAALRAIADAPGAVVCHCAAGKDRTGTIVGVALLLAGATPDAVVADFAASAERVPMIMARLARRPAYASNLVGKSVEQQTTRGETMRLLIEALERQGGVEAWLTRHGWTAADTARLRAKLRAE